MVLKDQVWIRFPTTTKPTRKNLDVENIVTKFSQQPSVLPTQFTLPFKIHPIHDWNLNGKSGTYWTWKLWYATFQNFCDYFSSVYQFIVKLVSVVWNSCRILNTIFVSLNISNHVCLCSDLALLSLFFYVFTFVALVCSCYRWSHHAHCKFLCSSKSKCLAILLHLISCLGSSGIFP